MTRLRFLTAGESHGRALVGILEGLPAGLWLEVETINRDLARRQRGHGRGGRMKIERDRAEIMSGLRFARTLGSPLAIVIENQDWQNWTERMAVGAGGADPRRVLLPRPGHADLAGGLKYGHANDLRNVLERASARETAMRVALGAVAKALLRHFGIRIGSYVRRIGAAEAVGAEDTAPDLLASDAEALALRADQSEVRALDAESSTRLVAAIDEARRRRDTVGGIVEVVATGVPVGLGSHVHADRKLDGRIGQAMLSIPAIKAAEIGNGWAGAHRFGSEFHDPITLQRDRLQRLRNCAGGLEGGISNGEPLVVRLAMKPIATVAAALPSVHVETLEPMHAHIERSDTCAVAAAGVVAEAVLALVLADALLEALGGDTIESLRTPFARLRVAQRTALGHVFLLGPMAAGKSTSGALLARQLGLGFIDLDRRIEADAGCSIATIFRERGEAGFRALEANALATVATSEATAVVALGGGAVLCEESWRVIRSAGVSLWLDASPAALWQRIQLEAMSHPQSVRPLLEGCDPQQRLRELCHERARWFERADAVLDTEGLAVEEVAYAAAALLRTLEGPLVRRPRARANG